MRIRKVEQAGMVKGKINNTKTDSNIETYSCDYINSKTDWKYWGTNTGQVWWDLPTEWNELNIMYVTGGSTQVKGSGSLAYVIKDMLQFFEYDSNIFVLGMGAIPMTGSASSSTVQGFSVGFNTSNQIRVNYVPGSTANTKIYVFYK